MCVEDGQKVMHPCGMDQGPSHQGQKVYLGDISLVLNDEKKPYMKRVYAKGIYILSEYGERSRDSKYSQRLY